VSASPARRCFVEPARWRGTDLRPDPEAEHHLLDVLRVRPGDEVIVFDGAGREARARVVVARHPDGRRRVRLELTAAARQAELHPRPVTLVQAVPKGGRMDWIVEKAAELGVSAIWPVLTERTVTRLDARKAAERRERWRRIARGAARQCGSAWIPDVRTPRPFDEAVSEWQGAGLALIASLAPGARPFREVAAECAASPPRAAALLIGPEGDFTAEETARARAAGAIPVSFGERVLRVETAALFGLSLLVYELFTARSPGARSGSAPGPERGCGSRRSGGPA
jgi:16S rRNA (uracil1498-N3)-methyltransferase